MMSMQTMFDPRRAEGFNACLAFRFGERSYVVQVADGVMDVRQAPAEGADVVIDASPEGVAGILYGGAPLESVKISGDKAVAERFTTLFDFPSKAA
jgi:hypothetical protein